MIFYCKNQLPGLESPHIKELSQVAANMCCLLLKLKLCISLTTGSHNLIFFLQQKHLIFENLPAVKNSIHPNEIHNTGRKFHISSYNTYSNAYHPL